MKFLKMNDRARAEEGYNYYVDMMPVMPYANAAGVRAVLQFLVAGQPKAATVQPESSTTIVFSRGSRIVVLQSS